jgi:hypothetical protein
VVDVRKAAGSTDAERALSDAFELYQRKGNLAAARSVSERLNSRPS